PVLVEVPWPERAFSPWPAFALLALVGAFVAVRSLRRGNRFVTALGGALALAALALAFTTRGARFSAGPIEVRSWGVAFAFALAAGSALAIRRGVEKGLARELVADACIAAAVGGVVGARLVWVFLHSAATGSVDGAFGFYRGGLSAWGGIAGAIAGAAITARRREASLTLLCDAAAPSFGLCVALTRFGCFLEGCDFGVPLGSGAPHFLATLGTFPKGSPAWANHVLTRGLSPSTSAALPVHPIELYEAVGGMALIALAFVLDRRKRGSGVAFGGVAVGYLLLRVSLDWLRDDPVDMWVSRALLFPVLFGAMVIFSHFRSRAKREK
ncbi:MAG TPA: prolipoprotein diacylglyceryl transferase family protein, partial [Polyangiaceae bacterium]